MNKPELRKQKRRQRRSLTSRQQKQASVQLLQQIRRTPEFKRCRTLAAYLPSDGEISPFPIIKLAQKLGKRCYLPVIGAGAKMTFARYRVQDSLRKNQYGIHEPLPRASRCPVAHINLILMPLVAFDSDGNRLGMGGGYYDRALAKKRKFPSQTPRLFGLAHSFQKVDTLPWEPWDIPLDAVVTEKEWIAF